MNIDQASLPASADNEYPWFRDGSMPHSREDRVAEVVALIALVFSLSIGLVIALLPVSASAAPPASESASAPSPESCAVKSGHGKA
jgi:hypothetical protein